jgi:hypothetical protein
MPERFAATAAIIRDAVARRAFPAAAIEVGRAAGPLWNQAFGNLTYDPGAFIAAPDTVFDIASLTKVIATATLVMRAVDEGRVTLDAPISTWLSEWRGTDRNYISIRDLMAHCSGLTAYLPFFRDIQGRRDFQAAICSLPLEYAPRTHSVYSDLGFILIGFILEDVAANNPAPGIASPQAGQSHSLAAQFQRFAIAINARDLNQPRLGARQLSSARLGHDAAHLIVWHAPVAVIDRPHRVHRHLAVDRLGARHLCGVPHESRAPYARERGHSTDQAARARCSGQRLGELTIGDCRLLIG